MKRYEMMTKEEIIEAFVTSEKASRCGQDQVNGRIAHMLMTEDCMVKPRFKTIKNETEMMDKAKKFCEFCNRRDCGECLYRRHNFQISAECFAMYLCEAIEVGKDVSCS